MTSDNASEDSRASERTASDAQVSGDAAAASPPATGRPIGVPRQGLVVLVGASASGKSTFAATHFGPFEVISSDYCRGLVSNDENDQSATKAAFEVLNFLVGVRLDQGLLTVVDATSVQRSARSELIALAKAHDSLVDAIVLDPPEDVARARHDARSDRGFGFDVVRRQRRELERSMRGLRKEGFRKVHVISDPAEPVRIVRERSWNDRSDLAGPFDIVGDVHGCAAELYMLLGELGYALERDESGRPVGARHPAGRTAVFVGDLVDRGPNTPGVLRLVMGMCDSGNALCVSGNHEAKLARALAGSQVTVSHGLAESLAQLAAETAEFRTAAERFMKRLVSHFVLDEGRLVVAHAGLKEEYHGRSSARVRAFALYGDTTGETDEYGLPVRLPWARDYRGKAMVVYGHTPVSEPEWVNNTICVDTAAVFGGKLTALRYPERELVSVPALREWCVPARPLESPTKREPTALNITDVTGTRWLQAGSKRIKVNADQSAAALEVMSRFAVDPRWLVYLPPTMSPASTSTRDGYLEHPEQAFEDYRRFGVTEVVCEEKHMGSRAIVALGSDGAAAKRKFGADEGEIGCVYTRTGRAFFPDEPKFIARVRSAFDPLFDSLATDYLVIDCELLPWSAKALDLIVDQYATVGAAAGAALPVAIGHLDAAAARGRDVADLLGRATRRDADAAKYRAAYRQYVGEVGIDAVTIAPFQILAAAGQNLATTRDHRWQLKALSDLTDPMITHTRHRFVDLTDPVQCEAAIAWWEELTAAGGEGMVVKPVMPAAGIQPGLKVRGRDYLRLIYGPDYTDSLDQLRSRNLGRKRKLAMSEYALGLAALDAFIADEPLWKVHELVFAVLALESEPVDPRL